VALNPSLSPDERRVALFMAGDLFIFDLQSRTSNRLTIDPAVDFAGIWSPDGSRIAFASNRKGEFDLYQKNATGAGGDELLLQTPHQKIPTDWSQDAQFLLYRRLDAQTSFDIWALSMTDRKPFPVVQTANEERDAVFSPDGRWIAYQSNESGRFEIWVRPFPFPGTDVKEEERWQFSIGGGTQARWGRTGREIFYLALDGTLMSVPVQVQPGGHAIAPGPARPLFPSGLPVAFGGGTALPYYMVSRDGQRFLMSAAAQPPSAIPIKVLVNWQPK
jgi:Tol biopolymer transport system component